MKHATSLETPLVLLCTSDTPFADYLAEILCTEGLPWFERVDSGNAAAGFVGKAGVLLVPRGATVALNLAHAWLEAGGCVVGIRPTAELAALAGIRSGDRTAAELPLTLAPPFAGGLCRAHGETDLWNLLPGSRATVHAHVLCADTEYPAVVSAPCGGGHVVAFAYDLPRSLALTRQGNPRWAGERGTDFGSNTFRPADLFVRGCGQETWLHFPSAHLPVADLQQRLLADLLTRFCPVPLPRLWYLPNAVTTVVALVGDSDGAGPEVVAEQLGDVTAGGGCMSAFLIDYTVDRTSAATVAGWRAAGHEISIHPDYGLHGDKSRPERETMVLTQRELLTRFRRKFGFAPCTARNHSAAWVGFTDQADLQRRLGIRLDSANVYLSGFAKEPFGGPRAGYLNGSGQPQKFVDEQGGVLDIYQLGVQLNDEMLKPQYLGIDGEGAWEATRRLLHESRRRWHSYVTLSFHPLTYHSNPQAKHWLRDRILPYLRDHGIPVWSTERVLHFADGRRECGMADLRWNTNELRFVFHAPRRTGGLTLSLPAGVVDRRLTHVSVGDRDIPGADLPTVAGRRLLVVDKAAAEIGVFYD